LLTTGNNVFVSISSGASAPLARPSTMTEASSRPWMAFLAFLIVEMGIVVTPLGFA